MRNKTAPVFCRGFWLAALFFVLVPFVPAEVPSSGSFRARLAGGVNLYGEGKWSEAVLVLRRAQAEAPSGAARAEALFWISLSELSGGQYEEALLDMDAAAEADPLNRRIQELGYHRGRALYYLGRYDEAVIQLKGYADSFPAGPGLNSAGAARKAAAFFWTGECLYSMGQFDKSADVFQLVIDDYPGSVKYEASVYRLALINQKKVELELLGLLKWSHEESLRNMEEYRQRESSYDRALSAYQRRSADTQRDTRIQDLEDSNARYLEQLALAAERIRFLESALAETSASLERAGDSASLEKLEALKNAARELENRLMIIDGDSRGGGR